MGGERCRGAGEGVKNMLTSEAWCMVMGCAPGQGKNEWFCNCLSIMHAGASIKHGRRWGENYLLRQVRCAK